MPPAPPSSAAMSVLADRCRLQEEVHTPTQSRCRSSSYPTGGTAAESLTDDLLVEILSRVPAKSLSRFKCVSKHWLRLTNDRHHRKKLPQTLAGFFCTSKHELHIPKSSLRFVSTTGSFCPLTYPYLAFLPNHLRVDVFDCCNGLLLCRSYDVGDKFRYLVCNPATEQWAVLPDPSHACDEVLKICLGFDPAVASHFYVFVVLLHLHLPEFSFRVDGVDVYSSETGRWVHKDKGWSETIRFFVWEAAPVFLNGFLHFPALDNKLDRCIAAVDTIGEKWTTFGIPHNNKQHAGFFHQSQGYLHYAHFQRRENGVVYGVLVHVLEDYDSKQWVLKHSVETKYMSGVTHFSDSHQLKIYRIYSRWMLIHPECNLIFFVVDGATTLMCYNMDRREAKVICSLDRHLPYFPYVPLYAELQSLHK